jgi:hypothetical protein
MRRTGNDLSVRLVTLAVLATLHIGCDERGDKGGACSDHIEREDCESQPGCEFEE